MNIIILGGGYGGLMTAFRLTRSTQVNVTLIDGSVHFQQRVRNHQQAVGQASKRFAYADWFNQKSITFVQGWVTAIQPTAKTVKVNTATGEQTLAYDQLVIGLGSQTAVPPEIEPHVLTLDARHLSQLQQAIRESEHKRGDLLIVGGGLTGIETALEVANYHPNLRVKLVTRGKFGASLSDKGRAYLRRVFDKHMIEIVDQTSVQSVQAHHATLSDGTTCSFDVCIWATSFQASGLIADSGLAVNQHGQLLMNPFMQSISHSDVYGVGDSANFVTDGLGVRMACATAMPMGAHVADNLLALVDGQPSLKPFNFGYMVRCISLGRDDGLIQWVGRDDVPLERVITGRMGAWVKELVCRFTVWALYAERRFPGFYRWAGHKPPITEQVQHGYNHTNI